MAPKSLLALSGDELSEARDLEPVGGIAHGLGDPAVELLSEVMVCTSCLIEAEPDELANDRVSGPVAVALDQQELERGERAGAGDIVLDLRELEHVEAHDRGGHLDLHGDAGAPVHLGDELDTARAQVHLVDLDVHADEAGGEHGAFGVLLGAPGVLEKPIIVDRLDVGGARGVTSAVEDAAERVGGFVVHTPIIGHAPLIVNSEKKPVALGSIVDLESGIGLPVVRCTHALLRELGGGVCPVCDATPSVPDFSIQENILPGSGVVSSEHEEVHHAQVTADAHATGHGARAHHGEGTPTQSGPSIVGCVVGASPAPPPTVRPPIVEILTPSSSPIGEAHGPFRDLETRIEISKSGNLDNGALSANPDVSNSAPQNSAQLNSAALTYVRAPAYMRRPLRTLTRAEATDLLTKLRARRMTARLSRFIRGPSGTGADGAWHVLEGGELDWNFHHDALCDHLQIMFEEWELAGIHGPKDTFAPEHELEVERRLELWLKQAEDETRAEYVRGMIAHWNKPIDEGGCGRKRYKQRTTDAAINVGPISLKSRIVMVFGIAWMWLRNASWEVFCSSGTPSNVDRDSIATRDLVTSEWYKDTFSIGWTIKEDLDRVSKWGTTAGGTREARGAGAKVTGIHADALLLDDPDDAAGVWSEASRRDIMQFWRALGNRLKDPTRPVRVIVQQNLHEEDLSTRCVTDGMPRLAIPVEFNPAAREKLYTMPFGWRDPRELENESLQPSRFTPEYIAGERKRLGTHGFEAQYNCNPVPIGGGLFARKWFDFFRIEDAEEHERGDALRPRPTGCRGSGGEWGARELHPTYTLPKRKGTKFRNELSWMLGQIVAHLDLDWLTISVDATFGSKKATSSAVALIVIGGKGQRRFVFDVVARPMTFLETVAALRALIAKWPAKKILIERKANGAALIEELTLLMAESKVIGVDGVPVSIVVEPIEPEGGKESRAAAMMAAIEGGMVYLLEGAAWLEAFLGEVCVFPNSKRDDQVDALSQLMTFYREPDIVSKWRKMAGKGPAPPSVRR